MHSEYSQAKDIECKNGNPSRMRTIAYLNKNQPGNNFHLKKDPLPDAFMKHIDDSVFFNRMNRDTRRVMKHMLLGEVANFLTPGD